MTQHNFKQFIDALPKGPNTDRVTDKYVFVDTKQVVQDMADLGYQVTGFRRPKARTHGGAYRLHEVEFMEERFIGRSQAEAPRILFLNSYDGTRRAQFAAGIIRFACLNGLIMGDLTGEAKFLHMGDIVDQMLERLKEVAAETTEAFNKIEAYKTLEIDDEVALSMAELAVLPRFKDGTQVQPRDFLQPRRLEDTGRDLWTRWNVLQENLIRGGVPIVNEKGQARLSGPVGDIIRSNQLNSELWTVLDGVAETVGA